MPVYTKVLAVAAQNTYYFLAFLRLATALILSENASLHTLQDKNRFRLREKAYSRAEGTEI